MQSSLGKRSYKFLKPGEGEVSWRQDRILQDDTSTPTFFYQPNPSLSLENQRQRLPIFQNRNHILYLLENFQSLVIVGETGCGKSTQIPQYLMEAGWCKDGKMVGITQPRRVAASTLATRVAEEKGSILGEAVGYSIRFDDCCTPGKTCIKYMTERILIREMMSDPLLKKYCAVLVDEVHERSIDTDILLGLLKKILRKRQDLKLIVASATVDAEELRDFFNDVNANDDQKNKATILSVAGRTFPVDIFYVNEPVANYVNSSIETVIKIHESEAPGDILVFLTGQDEVEHAVSILKEFNRNKNNDNLQMLVFPMYGALPPKEQLKVFLRTPNHSRKVVVTTNIAEASLTIFGIVYVIDCGFAKLRYFNPATCTDSLTIVPISQSSAEQRAGRAGRVKSGKVYRLYTEEEFDKLDVATVPEMQRSNLAFPILQLKALGIENILRFHFPSAPPANNVVSALEMLFALEAVDNKGNLTEPLGLQMAEFPLSPFFSKMLLVSEKFGCSQEALRIVAMMQVQNVFMNPPGKHVEARKARHQFSVAEGDLITLLNVYDAFEKNHRKKSWCDKYYLNYKVLLRATEVYQQLSKLLSKCNVKIVSSEGDVDDICRCITAGFFPNAAYLHHSGVYKTIRGDHILYIHQTSVLYTEKPAPWLLFNEVMMTSKEYMRDLTAIDPKWLCELAPHYYQFGTVREVSEAEAKR